MWVSHSNSLFILSRKLFKIGQVTATDFHIGLGCIRVKCQLSFQAALSFRIDHLIVLWANIAGALNCLNILAWIHAKKMICFCTHWKLSGRFHVLLSADIIIQISI